MAAGALATARRLGRVVGVAVAGGTWQAGLRHHNTTVAGTSAAFRDAFLVLAGFGVLAMLASWLRGDDPTMTATTATDEPLTGATDASGTGAKGLRADQARRRPLEGS